MQSLDESRRSRGVDVDVPSARPSRVRKRDLRAKLHTNLIRGSTLLALCIQHPTWAAAHLQNLVERQIGPNVCSDGEIRKLSVEEAVQLVTGADSTSIDTVLQRSPQPSLLRQSVLYGNPNASRELQLLAYAFCRLLTPELVVETGVANGFTTSVILKALKENGHGALVSIDLPHLHPRAVASIGAAVDPELMERWELHLGPASRLLSRIPFYTDIGILIHDASHTFRGQLAEYRAGWSRIKPGGVLMSDDITSAFEEFSREVMREPILVDQPPKRSPIGILRKSGPDRSNEAFGSSTAAVKR